MKKHMKTVQGKKSSGGWIRNQLGKSITVQLMLFFLMIWSVISILLMSVLYWTQRQMTERILEGQKERVSYYAAIVNADLSRVTSMLQQMCSDEEVAEFLRVRNEETFDYQDYIAFQKSYEKLKNYHVFSMYIDDVFLVLPQTGELLRATKALTEIPDSYQEKIQECLDKNQDVFFSMNGCVVYLSQGASGTVVGVEVSVRHIRTMLNALNPGYFDCFLVEQGTGELLDAAQTGSDAKAVYQAIQRSGEKKDNGTFSVESEDHMVWLYDCVSTPGNYFQIYLFAKEEQIFAGLYRIRQIWIVITVMIFAVPFAVGGMVHHMLARPMKKLVTAMQAVEHQEWSCRLSENEPAEFRYVFRQYNRMVEEIEILIRQVYEKQVQAEQARRRQLQAQINPHFLYNSFYMGYRMAKSGESKRVANLCMYLGDYFKVMTYAADNWIQLEQELKFVEIYLRLNEMRFEDKLEYQILADEEARKQPILPLMIQPLVENAIRHGVEKVQKCCRVTVEVHMTDGMLRCEVTDDCGTASEEICEKIRQLINQTEIPEKSFGLWNIQKRLLTMGSRQGLQFFSGEDGSFRIWFELAAGERSGYVQSVDCG